MRLHQSFVIFSSRAFSRETEWSIDLSIPHGAPRPGRAVGEFLGDQPNEEPGGDLCLLEERQPLRLQGYDFGEGCYCSEPVFAPQPGYPYLPEAEKEPGWLLTEVYDSRTRKSFLAILRADRVADGPVANIHLQHHVPFSYHGWWQGLIPRSG